MEKTTDTSQHNDATADRIKFYEQALELMKNAPDSVKKDDRILLEEYSIERALSVLRLSKEFQIPLVASSSSNWATVEGYHEREYMNVGFFPKGEERISWPDDGRQPEDEYLLVVRFPTGAYIFGDYFNKDYPTDAFNAFFDDLKSYGPKYTDTVNHCLYFTADVAKDVYWNFRTSMDKHRGDAIEENKRRKREKLEAQLKELNDIGQSQ